MAEQLLSEFGPRVSSLSLIPGEKGKFEVTINGELVFSKKETRRFPELNELREKLLAKV